MEYRTEKEALVASIEDLLDLLTTDHLEYVLALVKRFARNPKRRKQE